MSCSFLSPVPVPANIIRGHAGHGGIAENLDGTLVASLNRGQYCAYIYNAADRTADPIVVGTRHTSGSAHRQLHSPTSACFVHRDGVDTLLICDFGNNRVVEVSARGEFMRAIAVEGRPWGITFTADGLYILVADYHNHRVSKFSAASGAFVAQVISNGISRDVLQCEDGSIVVAHSDGMACVGKDGVTVQNIIISSDVPCSLSNSPSLNGVVVKCFKGSVFVLRDAWSHSLRCAWVQACVRV
jgi:DNA-binding beta-propeller fold protein YncE